MRTHFPILPIFLFSFAGCAGPAQTHPATSAPGKASTMEKFDVKTFEETKRNGERNFRLPDGSTVRQLENKDRHEYQEEIREPQRPFTRVRVYFASGLLKIDGRRFYRSAVGTWQYFDESGKVTKEVNWDAPFKFTVEDLDKKMRALGVDIMIMDGKGDIDVTRIEHPAPIYRVTYPVAPDSPGKVFDLVIDGVTGKTVSKKTLQIEK